MTAVDAPAGMNASVLRGLSFGLTSGVLTTLGLMVGLNSGTGSVHAVASGVLTIAVTDALSDAMGVHVSEEAAGVEARSVWIATISTFVAKFVFALTFLVPLALFSLGTGVLVAIAWGVALLTFFSAFIARTNGDATAVVIGEHLAMAALVVAAGQAAGWTIERVV